MIINGCRAAIERPAGITAWVLTSLLLVMNLASADPRRVVFDASRLRTGTFAYRDVLAGGPPAFSTTSISRLPNGNYRFVAEFPSFDQSWTTTATGALAPVATQLEMRTRQGQHYQLVLTYVQRNVTGHVVIAAAPNGSAPGSESTVTGRITPDTVDQRIDWVAAMSTDKRPGESFDFQVYDAKTGLSAVHCQVSDAGIMDTPAGKVRAIRINYTVHKATGAETYVVYTTATFPRVMLREELRGNLVHTLVSIKRAS
jgi:hypothetical protein